MSDLLIDFSKFEKNPEGFKKSTHVKKKSIKNISAAKNPEIENLTSKDIQNSLSLRFINHKYLIYNAYIFEWESDYLSLSESGYFYEVEIKVTRSDFKDDFNKKEKHLLLENNDISAAKVKPNKFFYATPKGLLKSYEIPAYAGLIEISSRNTPAEVIKDSPFLHKEKLLETYKTSLLDKFYWRYNDLMRKIDLED